jgi:hypothetical protein
MSTHIRLELRPDGETFTGRATSDEASLEFHGWLGLMGVIEALYPAAGEAAAEEEERTRL